MNLLKQYGANERFVQEAEIYPGMHLARVTAQSRDLCRVVTEDGEGYAEVSGRYRHEAPSPSAFPVTGDFVMVDRTDLEQGNAIIHHLLTRKSAVERPAPGGSGQVQVLAANIDYVFICMSLSENFNLNRLERYLAVAWDSRATPVVVLTKADLCDRTEEKLAQVSAVSIGAQVLVTSALQDSADELASYLTPGITGCFVGSSGVGKSTLINLLAGGERMATSHIREKDGRGRHTTTHRELLLLPGGGIVIDTPGIRELGVESADLSKSFADIEALAEGCRFRDCTHGGEPGCAVQQALENGTLDERRLTNYRKLQKESGYDGLSSRQIENRKLNSMFGGKNELKQMRDYLKHKNNRNR